jgi:hypothetical protein
VIRDAILYLTDGAQAIPTDGAADIGENVIDLAVTSPAILAGNPFRVVVDVTTAFTDSANAPTLTVDLYSHTTSTVTSGTLAFNVGVLNADEPSASHRLITFSAEVGSNALARYIGLVLTPSSNEFTAGAIRAWISIA